MENHTSVIKEKADVNGDEPDYPKIDEVSDEVQEMNGEVWGIIKLLTRD